MNSTLPKRTVALLGIGHTNAHIVRMWKMNPIDDAQLVCISNHPVATYSGMLPGVLAGQYSTQQMEIDLVRLCASARARLILDSVIGLDVERQQIQFESRPPLRYDVMSIGIGSMPNQSGVDAKSSVLLPIKPMQTFLARLEKRVAKLQAIADERPLRVAVVGGGAGGVEIAFCLPKRIEAILKKRRYPSCELHVFQAGSRLVPGMYESTAEMVKDQLAKRGIQVHFGRRVIKVRGKGVTLANPDRESTARSEDSSFMPMDLVLWATSATAPPLLANLGLPTDPNGFLRTKETLESVADHRIFVVGDSGTIDNVSRPKAGIFAVRQGPILFSNIKNTLLRRENDVFQPQKDYLKLLNTGDGYTIGEYLGRTFYSKWAFRWKDYIDQKFMKMYQDYSMPMMKNGMVVGSDDSPEMRCLGCGGKVSTSVLSRVFERLEIKQRPEVIIGLDSADDAAVIKLSGQTAVTTDFFAAPLDDAYLVGRMAALNSLSDAWAMNAEPVAALTIATLPFTSRRTEHLQEDLLHEMLSGAIHEFNLANVSLVGGHTIEGPRTTLGFTVLANQRPKMTWAKSGLKKGDILLLTKPIGSGVLLAAHMEALCRADWFLSLRSHLVTGNQTSAEISAKHKVAAVTDVTGFGLAGHLFEMLKASNVSAELSLDDLDVLPGAIELSEQGIESTLAPANRVVENHIDVLDSLRDDSKARYDLLFDPQTCGGLLLAVSPAKLSGLCGELESAGVKPCKIGRIQKLKSDQSRIHVLAKLNDIP